jgi:hypothetical protein
MMQPYALPPLDINQRYTIPEACLYLRESRAKIYKDIAAGNLEVIKDGSRTYVPGRVIAERSGARPATKGAA